MTTESVGPERGVPEHKEVKVKRTGSGGGHEISKEEELTPEELRVREAEEESLQRSGETLKPAKPLSPGDVRRHPPKEKPLPLIEQVLSPGPKTPHYLPGSPGPGALTPKPFTPGPRSPSTGKESPAIEATPSPLPGVSPSPQVEGGEPVRGIRPSQTPQLSESVLVPTVTRAAAARSHEEVLKIRSMLTRLHVRPEVIDAITKAWPNEWQTWAEPVAGGQEVYRQLHDLKGVKVHRDDVSGQMVIDITLPGIAHGRQRKGRAMVRLMEDGRMVHRFRFKEPKTEQAQEAMAEQFRAIQQLKDAWTATGGRPEDDPLVPYLLEGRRETTHVGKAEQVVTRYVFERASGDLRKLIRDKDDDPLPEQVAMKNRPKALRICLDAARALSLMHARGFVHKDIQPKNILYLRGHGKITDFDTLSRVGSPFTPAGTPAYFPPENAPETKTATNDPSQDMFAFGVMLAEVLDPDVGAELHSICYRAVSPSELATVTQTAPQAVPPAVTQAAGPKAAVEKQQEEGEIEDIEDILEEEEGVVAEEEAVEEKEEREAGAAEAGALSEENKKVEETEEEKKQREEREAADRETGPEPTRWRLYFVQQDLRGQDPLLDLAADLISFNPNERPTAEQTATRLARALGEQ